MAGSGGWEQWEWDESLFAGAAGYYEQGRLPYAPGLAEAARLATVAGIRHATWVRERAEALPAGLGVFRVITFGASFHWMDRPRVARAVRTMLTPGGAVVQVDAPGYRADALLMKTGHDRLRYPPPPDEAMESLRRRYLGADRRAGQSIRNTSPGGEDDVFQAAGFLPARVVIVPDGREVELSVDQVVAGRFSNSGTAPHLFGDRVGSFESDLRALLADASAAGRFSVRLPDNILRIWQSA
jgi:hypothetical protein